MSWKQNNGRNRGHIDGIGHFLEGPPQFVDKATSDLDMNEHSILQLAKITGAIVSTRDPPYNTIAHTELANFLRFSDGSDSTNSAIVNVNTISNSEGKINIRSSTGIDVSGNTNLSGNFTIGHTGSGYDVKFYGDTTGKSISWNETPNTFIVNGTTQLLGNLTASGDISGNNLFATNKITAGGDISGNNLFSNNKITAGGDISGNNIFSNNKITAGGNITAAAGTISGNALTATGNITTATGTISGNTINAANNISCGSLTASGNITTASGNITAASGTISGGSLTASGNITTSSGDITAATGTISGGSLTASGNITSISGNITAAAGTISGGTITSSGNITAASGTISGGNITATSGSISGALIVTNNILFPGIAGIQTVPYISGSASGTLKYVYQTTSGIAALIGVSGYRTYSANWRKYKILDIGISLKAGDVIFINIGPYVAYPQNNDLVNINIDYGAFLFKTSNTSADYDSDANIKKSTIARVPLLFTQAGPSVSTFNIIGNMTVPSDDYYTIFSYFRPDIDIETFYYAGSIVSISVMVFNGI